MGNVRFVEGNIGSGLRWRPVGPVLGKWMRLLGGGLSGELGIPNND